MQDEVRYFFELTPERILDAVESTGLRCTGRCLQMNSMENRVYEVEVEVEDESTIKSMSDRFRVVKFYRPGRWSEQQILDEHRFLLDLVEAEIPVVPPLVFEDGTTLRRMPEIDIFFAVFRKQGGRSPDELTFDYADRIGRLLARVHAVGARSAAPHRLRLDPATYGTENLEFILGNELLPKDLKSPFRDTVQQIVGESEPLFADRTFQRVHGDCHFGNILLGSEAMFLVDFDDMVQAPCVQDLWLVVPGTDSEGKNLLHAMVEAYEEMRPFDRKELRLIEPLRALRMIHFAGWIGKRWQDPAFKKVFTSYGTREYWRTLLDDLNEELQTIRQEKQGAAVWASLGQ